MSLDDYTVTTDDIEFYDAHGWWKSPWVVDPELIDDLEYGASRYYSGERDSALPIELVSDWTPERGNVLRQNDYVSLQLEEFRSFLLRAPIAQVAGVLSRGTAIRLFHDQLLYKPGEVEGPHASVGWHTDRAYWATCSSTRMLTAWIAFQDTSVEMGTLVVLDGSHRWAERPEYRNFHTGDMSTIRERLLAEGAPVHEVALEFKRGQVSFHHCKTIHGSYPNRTATARLAFAVHMQDEQNEYREVSDAGGKRVVHLNDLLCRKDHGGRPDYTDPDVCPLLWGGP